MFRKLAITMTLVTTLSLAVVSSALAVVPADLGGSSHPTSTTSDGFAWGDLTIGIALAAVGIACLGGLALVSRNRRSAVLH
jgi:hypothetical protein